MKLIKLLAGIILSLVLNAHSTEISNNWYYLERNKQIEAIAEAIYFEARAEPKSGQIAVAYVIVNRAKSGKFPDSPVAVITQGCEFSYRCDKHYDVITDTQAYNNARIYAALVVDGLVKDPTNGALFYKNSKVSKQRWTRKIVAKIGNHTFYI